MFFRYRITHHVSLSVSIFYNPFQSCRSIGFQLMHDQTKLSYRDVSYNRNGTRTINLPQQREHRADFPPSSFTQPFRNPSRAKHSCDHSTREYSFVDVPWRIMAQCEICPSLLFVRPSHQSSAAIRV